MAVPIPIVAAPKIATSVGSSFCAGSGRPAVRGIRKSEYRSTYMFIALPLAATSSIPIEPKNIAHKSGNPLAASAAATTNVTNTMTVIRILVSSTYACTREFSGVEATALDVSDFEVVEFIDSLHFGGAKPQCG